MSVCFSSFDTAGWLILRVFAILAWDFADKRRSSLSDSTSSTSSLNRRSSAARLLGGKASRTSFNGTGMSFSQLFEMRLVTCIRRRDQPLVKPRLARPALISRDQQDRTTLRIESESYPPNAAIRPKSQFLHVRKFRTVQRIDMRPTELGAVNFKQSNAQQQLVLNRLRQRPV